MGSLQRSGLFFGLSALTAMACGGIDEPNFFSSDGTATSLQDSGTSSADSGHVTGNDGGTTPIDSGILPVIDSGGPATPDPGIFCGTNESGDSIYCPTATQFCCATGAELGVVSLACGTDKNTCTNDPTGGLVIPCDDTLECGGDFCCGTFDTGTSMYSEIRCQSTCKGTQARIFCDPANGNADCGGTGNCDESGSLAGFHVCGT